jgi:hypothetical protein
VRFASLLFLILGCSLLPAAPAPETRFDLSADVSETDLAAGENINHLPAFQIALQHWGLSVALVPPLKDRLYGAVSFQLKFRFQD